MKKEETFLKHWFQNFKHFDRFFFQLTIALVLLGLTFAFLSSTYESNRLTNSFWNLGIKQFAACIVGSILFFFLQGINYKFWYRSTWLMAAIAFFLMAITIFSPLGKVSGGSQRWLNLVIIQFQPAEVAKFTVVLLIARFLTKYRWNQFKSWYYFLFSLILVGLILKQPDLGSASILVLLILELLFIFGWPIWFLSLCVIVVGLIGYIKINLTPYQLERINFWLHPELDPQGKGYNLIQAQYALAFGGILGTGIGSSIQKQGYLPIPHSDFIFAVIAEEVGFIGVTVILILYLTWILRAIYLINKVDNKYGRILGTAIILLIATQASINICVAIGLLPVTGVTLPFFSCGGTSLITTLAMCGILYNILLDARKETAP